MVNLHQASGQNRAAFILRDGKERAADHILQRVLGQREALALDLRQLRIFDRIKAGDCRADACTADGRLHALADGDIAGAAGELTDDFAEQLARQNSASFLGKRRGKGGFDTQREIRAGQAQTFIAGFKKDAFQNRLGGAHGKRAADNGKGSIEFIGIADKSHFIKPPWGSSSIYVQQKES